MTKRSAPLAPRLHAHLRLWRRALRHAPARRFFLLLLATPSLFVLLSAILLPLLLPAPEADPAPAHPVSEEERRLLAMLDSIRVYEAFWFTRLAMAERPEAAVTLDLVDSTLTLSIQGVPVRTVPVRRFRISASLRNEKARARLAPLLTEPFTLKSARSTIPRVPLQVAPRDTVEAQARAPLTPPVETRPIHFTLWFDRGLTLSIDQAGSRGVRRVFSRTATRVRAARYTITRLARGRAADPDYWIRLELDAADARAFYRALPADARLALRL